MRRFNISVNGTPYDVQVEEIAGNAAPAAIPVAAAHAVVPAAPAPVAAPAAAAAGSTPVKSPMPGTILDIKVNVGDQVSANQVLLVLEAMKMENDIVAPSAGTVAGIHISKGATVETGTLLVSLS